MKKLAAVLMASVMVLGMVGCGSKEAPATEAPAETTDAATETEGTDAATEEVAGTDTAESTEAVGDESARTQLIVGFDAEYPPYGYQDDNGEYVGFDLSLAQEVCDRNGWELIKQPINWDSKDLELNSGSIDCIWNGFTLTGRENDYTWSEPYVDNSIVVVVNTDSDVQAKADLAGKVVATQSGSSALTALTDDSEGNEENIALAGTFAELQEIADYNTAFMNLEAGAIDAIAVDIGVAKYQLESREGAFRMLEEPISTEQYGIGFKLGNESLRDAVMKTLNEMVADGTFAKIAEEWELSDMVCLGE